MASLDEIEAALHRDVVDGELALSAHLRDLLGFPQVPPWLGDIDALKLRALQISQPAGMLLLTGDLDWPVLGNVAFACEVVLEDGSPSAKVRWVLTRSPSLPDLCAGLDLTLLEDATRFLDGVVVQAIRIQDAATGDLSVSFEVAGAIEIGFGGVALRLALTSTAFGAAGTVLTQVRGTATVGGLVLPLIIRLAERLQVAISAPDLSLADLATGLGLSLPPLPPLPLIDRPLDELRIALEHPVRLSARTPLGDLGTVTVVIAESQAGLLLAAGLDPSPDFRFSNLSPALSPLDVLLQVVRFGAPALVLATGSGTMPYLNSAGEWVEVEVEEGAALRGAITLDGLGLDLLGALLGINQLPFVLPLAAAVESLRLAARLPYELEPLPGVLRVKDVQVSAAVQPFSLSAEGVAELSLFGARLPELVLGVTLGAAAPALYLRTAEPWRNPAGLPIDIEELGLQLSSPPPTYGAFGKIRLRDRTLEAAAQFVGQAPTLLVAEAQGEMSLQGLLLEMVGAANPLPAFFSPTLRDPSIYIVLNPAGATIAGRAYPSGLGLSGRAGYMGFELWLCAGANATRISGEGGLSAPITLAGVLEITGPGGAGVPFFAFDTAGSPILSFGGRVSLLGIAQDVSGEIGAEGVTFALDQSVGPVEAKFSALLGEGNFSAKGVCSFALKAAIGPLKVGPASLGKINLDTGFDATTQVRAGASDYQVTLDGAFSVMGIVIDLPVLTLSPRSLADLPAEVLRFVAEHAEALFAELLRADVWLKAIAEKVIEQVENVALELKQHFEQTTEQIAHGLHDVLHYTTEETARALQSIGAGAGDVARALTGLGETPDQVARAMLAVGYGPQLVAEALKGLGHPAEAVQNILTAAGVAVEQIGDVIGNVFGTITNPPHIKVALPHIKVPLPHTKIPVPHIKVPVPHVKTPHIKVRW